MSEIVLTKIGDIPSGTGKQFILEGLVIALFNVDGKFFAIDDTCTHAEASLSEGSLEGTVVTCPHHGAQFDLKSGNALTLPAVTGVRTYPIKIQGDEIKIVL